MKYTIQYICILFLTTSANIYSADNSSVTKAGLTPLKFPTHIDNGDLKPISITNFSHICFFKLNDKNTICYAVANVQTNQETNKTKIIKTNTQCSSQCYWSTATEKFDTNNIYFFGPLGSDKICALQNGDIYITKEYIDTKNKKRLKWINILNHEISKSAIITSCVGLSNKNFWVTTYNNQTKKTFTVNLVLDEETQKYNTKEEPTGLSTLHVAITQNNDYGWFIIKKEKKKITQYFLDIVDDVNDSDRFYDFNDNLNFLKFKNDQVEIDSIHHLTPLNNQEAFFLDQNNNRNIYKLTNTGDISLLLQHTEPIDAIGIWDNRLILTIRNQLYRYIPVNMAKIEDKNLDDQKEALIKTSETASPAIPSSQSLSTHENTQEKPIEINTTEPITETVLPTIPLNQSPSTSVSNQEPLEEIKKSEPPIIEKSVETNKNYDFIEKLLNKNNPNEARNLNTKFKKTREAQEKPIVINTTKPVIKTASPTTTSSQPVPTSANNQKPNPSYFEPFRHYLAAILYYMSPSTKQPTQNPIQTIAPQEKEKTIKQPGTYYQTLKNWFNNIKNWWLPF